MKSEHSAWPGNAHKFLWGNKYPDGKYLELFLRFENIYQTVSASFYTWTDNNEKTNLDENKNSVMNECHKKANGKT